MRQLSEATMRVTSKNFSRKFVSLGRIVKSWDDIMGAKFASKAVPRRIQYRKPIGQKDSPQAILEIETSQADATLLHYQSDLILERMERLFGERWITGVKFVPIIKKNHEVKRENVRKPLTATQKNHLSEMLCEVDDPVMQEKLQALGQGILGRE
jgi:hypothetical protein